MEEVLVSFAIPDVPQMGYQLQCVQWVFLPGLKTEHTADMSEKYKHVRKMTLLKS